MEAISSLSELIIREAVETDDRAVGDMLVRAFAAQFSKKLPQVVVSPERKMFLRRQSDKRATSTVLVAEADGRLVGTVSLCPWGALGSKAWISGSVDMRLLAIDVAFQGRGLSGALLDEVERRASAQNAAAICLHVRRGAHGIARLYNARGYVREPVGDIDQLPEVFLEAYALRLSALHNDPS